MTVGRRDTPQAPLKGGGDTPQAPLKGGCDTPQAPLKGGCDTPQAPLKGGWKGKIIPYNPKLKQRARELRNNSTLSEILLWKKIKGRKLGFQFHRQVPLDQFIVDFYCHELRLAIEIDGSVHDSEDAIRKDKLRQSKLEGLGVRFLRFRNREVKGDMDYVLGCIGKWIEGHPHTPRPPSRGE